MPCARLTVRSSESVTCLRLPLLSFLESTYLHRLMAFGGTVGEADARLASDRGSLLVR